MVSAAATTRREFLLRGVVQGVGFRPHVAVVASRHPVTGFCGNDDQQVFIEAQGAAAELDAFLDDLLATLPPLARVIGRSSRELPVLAGETGFAIVPSRHLPGVRTLIPPDVATCADCLAELADPADRRHRYPFINCTNCGPRLTIIQDLPYDRPATTMSVFEMCAECAGEYRDPADRRYHAQPISCFHCGPALWLVDAADARAGSAVARAALRPIGRCGAPEQGDALAEARRRLRAGEVLAVKGLGGFHLMCVATDEAAVARLRERKRRSGKPFAVMVPDLATAQRLAVLDAEASAALAAPARPIVIAEMAAGYDLAEAVAPGLRDVGLLLPYTPLHTLLLGTDLVLVATSGNLSEEPLCYTNADALDRLADLADAFLLHDRNIHVPVEDSVGLAVPGGEVLPMRRSRGYAPLPVVLPPVSDSSAVVLGVGGELKNTFALAGDDLAFVSAHIGDMGSLASQLAFEASVRQLVEIHRREPEVVVCDLHPGYATTGWAERYVAAHAGTTLVRVQHHYAHALSLLAEHGIASGPVVVAAVDGTGYGTDGTIWGGEILTLGGAGDPSLANWRRSWHVPEFGLVGGDRAIRQPWRVAQGLAQAWGLDIAGTPAVTAAPPAELRLVRSQLESGFGVVATSSSGRLFDAAAALLGLCQQAGYEGQAAMALERAATDWVRAGGLSAGLADAADLPGVFRELLERSDRTVAERAWRFHLGLARVFAEQLALAASAAGTTQIGLTGGVAVNRIFAAALTTELRARGFALLTHQVVPPNDGGLSLGQVLAGRLAPRPPSDRPAGEC